MTASRRKLAWGLSLGVAGVVLAVLLFLDEPLGEKDAEAGEAMRAPVAQEHEGDLVSHVVEVESPAVPRESVAAPVTAPDEAAGAAVVGDAADWSLRVLLVDRDERPIRRVDEDDSIGVEATDESGATYSLEEDGDAFVLANLRAGRLWIDGTADGYRATDRVIDLLPEAPGERELVLRLEPELRVYVRAVDPSGAPAFPHRNGWVVVGGARVTAIATAEPPRARLLRDYAPGMPYRLGSARNPMGSGEPADLVCALFLDDTPPVYVSLVAQQAVLATELLPRMAEELVFVIEPDALDALRGTIRYRLVDAESGAALQPKFYMIASAGYATTNDGDAASTREARIVHERVAPGAIQLTAQVEGYESFRRRLDVEPGAVLDLGDVPLRRETTISGLVFGPGEEPVQAHLRFERIGDGPEPLIGDVYFTQFVSTTDDEGRFELQAGRGRYRVWARSTESNIRSVNHFVDTSHGPVDGLVIRCASPIDVTLRDRLGLWEGYTLRVSDAGGFPVESVEGKGPRPMRISVQPGRYRLAVLDEAGAVVVEQEFELVDMPIDVWL